MCLWCMYVCAIHIYGGTCACVHKCRNQRGTLDALEYPSYSPEIGIQLKMELSWQPVSPSRPPVSIPPSNTVTGTRGGHNQSWRCWDSNLGSHACTFNQYALTHSRTLFVVIKTCLPFPSIKFVHACQLPFLPMSPSPFGIFGYQMPNLACKVISPSSWLQGTLCFLTL